MRDSSASESFACRLTIVAWRLGDLTLTDLWWRYTGLGGTGPPDALGAYLERTTPWPAAEHNVLAQALNERLWDLRCPSLAPYRHLQTAHRAGPRTGPDGTTGTS